MFLARFFSSEGMDLMPDGYLFTFPHFLYIAVSILVIYWMLFRVKTNNQNRNKWIVTVMCILLLFFKYAGEVIFIYEFYTFSEPVSSFSHSLFDWRTLISFQMCGINNVLLPFVIWFNIKPMKDFIYTTSVIGGIVVILYPSTVLFGDPFTITFPMIRSLIVHLILVVLPLYLIRIGDFKLEKKYWYRSLIGSILTALWALYGNIFVDPNANFMFMTKNPFYGGPIPLLNLVPSGWHVILVLLLILIGFIIVYKWFFRIQDKLLKQHI
jgi:hypothetical protein